MNGYCEAHRQERKRYARKRTKEENQAHNALYDNTWRVVRKHFIAEHPLCKDCLDEGTVRAAEEVHHIMKANEHPDLRLDANNLMSLCKAHHNLRTARGE